MGIDNSVYTNKRRQIGDEFAQKVAANDYGRFAAQQSFNRNKYSAREAFKRSHAGFAGSFARRGLSGPGVRSGTFEQATSNRFGDQARRMGQMQNDFDNQNRQFDMQLDSINNWRQQALADLEMQKARDIAMAALNIQALRPLLGG